MATLGSLVIELNANVASLQRDMGRAASIVEKNSRAIGKAARVAGNALASLGAGLSVGALSAATLEAARAADEIGKLSLRLGISTEALSQYQFVAERTGVAFNALAVGLQRMTRRVAEAAQGTGEARGALRELGVDAERLTALAPEQQFEVLAEAFQRVADNSDRVRLAFKLFDSEGVALLQTMEGGASAIRALRTEAAQAGLTLSSETAAGAAEVVDEIANFRATFKAASFELVNVFGPAITSIIDLLGGNASEALRRFERSALALTGGLAGAVASAAEAIGAADLAGKLREFEESQFEGFAESYARTQQQLNAALQEGANAAEFLDDSLASLASVEDAEKRVKAEQKYIAALERELALVGDATALAKARFEIEQGSLRGASEATRQRIEALAAEVDAVKAREAQEEAFAQTVLEVGDEIAAEQQRRARDVAAVFEATRTPLEAYAAEVRRLSTLGLDNDTLQRAVDQARENMVRLQQDARETSNVAEDLGLTFASAFEDAVVSAGKFSDVLKGLGQDILRILARETITKPVADLVKGIFSSGSGLSGLFGGARASGGPVSAGRAYLVGERGPELFMPKMGGQIIPNGAGGAVVNIINQSGGQASVSESVVNGQRQIDVLIESSIGRLRGSGRLNRAGLAPARVSR